jgi:hypothetical protein
LPADAHRPAFRFASARVRELTAEKAFTVLVQRSASLG